MSPMACQSECAEHLRTVAKQCGLFTLETFGDVSQQRRVGEAQSGYPAIGLFRAVKIGTLQSQRLALTISQLARQV